MLSNGDSLQLTFRTFKRRKANEYGVTYKEDKPVVVAAIQRMKDEGLYPQHLWEGK